MRYLVDPDWIISGLAGLPPSVTLLADLERQGLAVSVVTLAEVFEGAWGHRDPVEQLARYRAFLAGFAVLDVTEPVVEVFARIRADLRRQGNRLPDLDLLIAATALHHDLTLLTRNVRHFERVPGLQFHSPQ